MLDVWLAEFNSIHKLAVEEEEEPQHLVALLGKRETYSFARSDKGLPPSKF